MPQINAYGASGISNNNPYAAAKSGGNQMDVNDFMSLLAAQLANQDVMNPSTDTEFISQMAQFTALEATQTMTELIYAQYGASMVGKSVIVASYDNTGKFSQDEGVVEKIKFASGDCIVQVNGKDYTMSSIMEVLSGPSKPSDGEADKGESDNGGKDQKPQAV